MVGVLQGCDGASVTVRRAGRRFETLASSSDLVRGWDELQYQYDAGAPA
jgi:hypothetical protein